MAGTHKMTVDDVCKLMECMAQTKVGMMEWDGLKLALVPERPAPLSAASGIRAPEATVPNAMKAVQEARIQAAQMAQSKLSVAQTRTARARQKAAGGITDGTLKAVEDIYKDAVSTPVVAPVAPTIEPSALSDETP